MSSEPAQSPPSVRTEEVRLLEGPNLYFPRPAVKVTLALELVARFHTKEAAEYALEEFDARFRKGVLPDDMPEMLLYAQGSILTLVQVLKQIGLTASTSEGLRMVESGAVRANGEKVSDKSRLVMAGETIVLQVGKRKFAKVTVA